MAFVHRCVEQQLEEYIFSRYPRAEFLMDSPCWYRGKCEILFYPHPRAVEPYAAIYENGSCYILIEF